jgi:hypothetical protein
LTKIDSCGENDERGHRDRLAGKLLNALAIGYRFAIEENGRMT